MMRRPIPSLLLIALLAGCTAGPDYAGPPKILSADTGHRFVRAGEDVGLMDPALAEWWVLLDDLVRRPIPVKPLLKKLVCTEG